MSADTIRAFSKLNSFIQKLPNIESNWRHNVVWYKFWNENCLPYWLLHSDWPYHSQARPQQCDRKHRSASIVTKSLRGIVIYFVFRKNISKKYLPNRYMSDCTKALNIQGDLEFQNFANSSMPNIWSFLAREFLTTVYFN